MRRLVLLGAHPVERCIHVAAVMIRLNSTLILVSQLASAPAIASVSPSTSEYFPFRVGAGELKGVMFVGFVHC